MQRGDELTFSVRPSSEDNPRHFQVSYEAFIDDVRVGDAVVMDGGMVIVRVDGVAGPDVTGTVIEPGKVMSRATLTLRREKELVRGYSSMLPVVTAKDWQDIDFAVEHKVRTFEGWRS
jgi:pyruvate kinase